MPKFKTFMKHIPSLITIVCILCASIVQAQHYTVPSEYSFNEPSEYENYRLNLIEAVNWLEITGLSQENEKRTKANKFIVDWVSGSPDVSVDISEKIVVFTEKNPELLTAFMGGWARLVIKDPTRASDKLGVILEEQNWGFPD